MKIDFDSAKNDLPLDRGELVKRIAETPLEVVLEYVDGLQAIKGNLDKYIAVMHAANSPCCEALLSQVSDEKLEDLQIITEILNDNDILSKIDQLTAATWGATSKGKCNKEKVKALLESIKSLDQFKLETVAGYCISMQQEFENLSRILLFYLGKNKNDLALKRHLGKIDEKVIDSMIVTCTNMQKAYETAF
jgi:hypothetical protein